MSDSQDAGVAARPTPVSHAYRHQVARCAAGLEPLSPIKWMAFGTDDQPYSPTDDSELGPEIARVEVSKTVVGPTLTVVGVLKGEVAGDTAARDVRVYTEAGTLVGRKVFRPKELEPDSEFEVVTEFEY